MLPPLLRAASSPTDASLVAVCDSSSSTCILGSMETACHQLSCKPCLWLLVTARVTHSAGGRARQEGPKHLTQHSPTWPFSTHGDSAVRHQSFVKACWWLPREQKAEAVRSPKGQPHCILWVDYKSCPDSRRGKQTPPPQGRSSRCMLREMDWAIFGDPSSSLSDPEPRQVPSPTLRKFTWGQQKPVPFIVTKG